MDAGLPVAACPGSAPFNLQGQPAGGTWSGTGITNSAAGTFSPTVSGTGTFKVVYSNAVCPYDSTVVTVAPISVQLADTVCQNMPAFNLTFSPLGGFWSGTGIINWFWGTFYPLGANAGVNILVYSMNGCSDTTYVTVNSVWAGWDISACPTQAPFALQPGFPSGGYWTGLGVDSVTGFYNPGYLNGGEQNSYAFYNVSGCQDTIIIYDDITNIIDDTLPAFCPYDDPIELDWETTHNYPWGGVWTGAGVLGIDSFSPAVAQSGWHKLYYSVNGCTDSTNVQVYFDPKLADTAVCNVQSPFQIRQIPPGGQWYGNGIVNAQDGTFSPQDAGMGTFSIAYVSADNCVFGMKISVDTIPVLNFTGLPNSSCFKDTNFILLPNYPNGVWSGMPDTDIFNPAVSGEGLHNISYSIGNGQCLATTSGSVFVSKPLIVSSPFNDTILCEGGLIRISATGIGGNNLNYNFLWNENLGNGTSYVVGPATTTTYFVTLSDGCSDPNTDSITVTVQSPFTVVLTTDTIKCYEKPSFIKATVLPAGSYQYNWSSDDNIHTSQINALAGHFYTVTVTDPASGCKAVEDTLVPSHGKILADFLPTPAAECVTMLSPEVTIIDQSEGATSGKWFYGDGKIKDYNDSTSLIHSYNKVGKFTIQLMLENAGGCTSFASKDVCVTQSTRLIAPTGFSPNGDGMNDFFRVKLLGVSNFTLSIFNRWGEEVFSTTNTDDAWDGTYKNEPCPLGVYVYMISYQNLELGKEEMISGNITLIR